MKWLDPKENEPIWYEDIIACFDIDGKKIVSVIFCDYDDDYFRDSINLKNYPLDKLKLISWMPMPVAPKSHDRYIWTADESKYMEINEMARP